MHTIDVESGKVKANQKFVNMSFESSSNEMAGSFKYPQLKKRLAAIKEKIINETKRWAIEGLTAKQQETRIADNLQLQHKQIVEDYKERKDFAVDLSMADDNPFVWLMTYFGRPMTNLGGGLFKIKIHLSTRFPDEQPRVFVETPIFHHRVSKDGVLCYFTDRPGELRYHIDAIVQTLEEEFPPFDPRRTVNLEASALFWGAPEDRKKYNRALRRSVEESTEWQD
jgi:ubiquitin-conjugating enzyme E2 Z